MVPDAPDMPDMLFKGKVRDTYPGESEDELVVVASDRISVFDVVLPTKIPGKGEVLAHMTEHWLTETPVADIMPNHFLGGPGRYSDSLPEWAPNGRSMVVEKLEMLKIEAIVRGYLTGSGWKEYKVSGKVSGIELPVGAQEMERFPEPLFTPSTKADTGHDENVDFERMERILDSRRIAEEVRDRSLEIYKAGALYALERGIILVDTKLEFGLTPGTNKLVLADEVLTPDSSRFVKVEDYLVGMPPASMDKQFVRDHVMNELGWDKNPPGPYLTPEIVQKTRNLYKEISLRLTGTSPID